MRDKWYGDNRDLVKWATLVSLAEQFEARHILQVLYLRPTDWEEVEIDGSPVKISDSVLLHFRNVDLIRNLRCGIPIDTLADTFQGRDEYLQKILAAIQGKVRHPGIVFLDPDTGLEPTSVRFDHSDVCAEEVSEI